MKTRIISAIVALAIFIPLFLIGGNIFNIGIIAVSLLALKEFIDIKSSKKEISFFIRLIAYMIMIIFMISNIINKELSFTLDYRLLILVFISLLLPNIFYHDRDKYSINDAFYLMGGLLFLSTSFSLIMLIRNISLYLIIYLFLITITTDTFAYFTGKLLGKHKLIESISPNKTWEGAIGGTIFGTIIPIVFYRLMISQVTPIFGIVFVTLFLSILGQCGDLVFSSIKRYFGKKDFSNIMPGHGGVLDRLDSIIFVMLGFIFFVGII